MRRRTGNLQRVLLESLEDRTLLAATVGSLDAVITWPNGMPFQVQGWAFDADQGPNGANPVTVRLDIDGFPALTQQATVTRPDLLPVVGSAAHGYAFTVSPLAPGNHTLRVVASDQPFGTEVVLGTRTVTVQSGAFGVLDTFDAVNGIRGWAFDPVLSTASLPIRVDIDGAAVTTQNATGIRQDLLPFFGSVNHGFSIAIPQLSQGPHTISVVALSLAGAPTVLGSFVQTPPGPPFGTLDVANENLIGGWAADPDTLSTGTRVRIDIDGAPFRTLTTDIQRPDLAQFGPGPFGFQFNTPLLGAGQHTVQMFAIDSPTGNAVLIGQNTFSVGARAPIGNVDLITATTVTTQLFGWALDPDVPGQPVQIRINIDGFTVLNATAAAERPDLAPIFGTSAHGFAVTLAPLSFGSHLIEVFGIDVQTSVPTLLKSSTVTVSA
jgi:hypothetical protein